MKGWIGLILAGAALGAASPAAAQSALPLSFEGRGEFAFPTGDFADGDAVDNGAGFGVSAMFRVLPMVGVYAGYERHTFSGDEEGGEFGNVDAELIDSGFSAGAQLMLPLALAGASPWVKGGVLFHTAEFSGSVEGVPGGVDFKSDRSTGFEVGAGVEIPLGMVLSFTPGVVYRSYKPTFEDFGGDTEDAISHLSVGMGLRFRL